MTGGFLRPFTRQHAPRVHATQERVNAWPILCTVQKIPETLASYRVRRISRKYFVSLCSLRVRGFAGREEGHWQLI